MKTKLFLYYGKKILVFLLSVWILSVAVFYISRLAPGDPLMSYYGERVEKMSVAEKEAAREKLGLNAFASLNNKIKSIHCTYRLFCRFPQRHP